MRWGMTIVLLSMLLSLGACGGKSSTGPGNGDTFSLTKTGCATMEMVWIEPGTFMMGSPSSEPGRSDNEGPQHQVIISKGFYLGKYEITQGQWTAVMGTLPWSGDDAVQPLPDHPAVDISWDSMQAFIHQLNQAAGDSLYRLPTEAEWEYACRAGTTTRWSFGDDESQLGDYAWYNRNAWNVGETYGHAVGTKKPNPWGLYDMHGNVWEWCQDWYSDGYSGSSGTDLMGPAAGSRRVVRGGGFYYGAPYTRSAGRGESFASGFRGYGVGARLLRTK